MTTGIQVFEKSHRYKVDGEWAIGVTTALKGIPKDEALKRWAANTVADYALSHLGTINDVLNTAGRGPARSMLATIPDQRRDDAATRGTDVHALAELYIQGRPVDVSADLLAYVRGFARFIEDFNPKSIHEELVIGNRKHMYAGRLDSIQDIPGLGVALVDYKTSNRIYGNNALQCAAYCRADCALIDGDTVPFEPIGQAFILHIQADTYDLIPVTVDDWAFDSFVSCLDHYRRNVQSDGRKLKALLGEPIKPPAVAA